MALSIKRHLLSSFMVFGMCMQAPLSMVFAEDSLGQWNQWRGPNRDGISTEKGLLESWPDQGPPVVFSVKGLGKGMASVAIADGKIITMGNKDGNTRVVCLNEKNGEIEWDRCRTKRSTN